ncbi:MAG: NAD(P)H-hydrate dehydratase [Pseudomonadota bacterium]
MTDINAQSHHLYTTAQVRELDRLAIEEAGIPGYTLMTRAGEACWAVLRAQWPAARSLAVFCGAGNNGGDGFVIARLALQANWQVQLVQLGDPARMQADAQQAHDAFLSAGGQVLPFTADIAIESEVIVDALLGTGVDRPLEGAWRTAIEVMNAATVPVLAVDIPSGLQADTGAVAGVAIHADQTVTFIGRKAGMYTGAAADHCGSLTFDDLDVPGNIIEQVPVAATLLQQPPLGRLASPRLRNAHKGHYGHVLVIGGDHGMAGAARLAGEAALRSGAGRVSLATRPEHATLIATACPELMCHGVASAQQLKALLHSASVLLIGPGLGRSVWAQSLLSAVLETPQPRVIDADALNNLAGQAQPFDRQVLTPHPGEAARLLDKTVKHVQADRFAAAHAISRQYGGTTVLKGAGTLIQSADGMPVVCGAGNPGMATAGTGDVLAGVIAALIAQGMAIEAAALAGVCAHACAGDIAAKEGERGLIARDVIAALRTVLNATRDRA